MVIETGARYLLDPLAQARADAAATTTPDAVDFLRRAVEIAADLGAEACRSGPASARRRGRRTSPGAGWSRLRRGPRRADGRGVPLGFEPEPGMLVETIADWRGCGPRSARRRASA